MTITEAILRLRNLRDAGEGTGDLSALEIEALSVAIGELRAIEEERAE